MLKELVSVPIRGSFNLTLLIIGNNRKAVTRMVSVPIRGSFNLTNEQTDNIIELAQECFRPH